MTGGEAFFSLLLAMFSPEGAIDCVNVPPIHLCANIFLQRLTRHSSPSSDRLSEQIRETVCK